MQARVPVIDTDLKAFCVSYLTSEDVGLELHSMKKGKTPGSDGLTIEFHTFISGH